MNVYLREALEELKIYEESVPDIHFYDANILTLETISICIEFLEKQKELKPVEWDDNTGHNIVCSVCRNDISGWEEYPNYCPNCGQRIDWSEHI